ncbi:hypothetical protein BJF92_00665 [Rhizobium rhizosphaerae]|uniref:Uncharacterized protein n=1 Tax=Xaviernesmea rhizosphaerae TaxID=1672749 RepID=A0A1Q9AEG7_9HYPH|nr:hypothetical protein [Xaviernesmea rhizosphaerae]OLP53313.1 hypothetical protein BJF92_00665 [Xaviernesmea rhizosphaerae]
MRQIAANGRHYFHHDLDERIIYHRVGFAWQWYDLLAAWDRFQRHQLLDCDDGFCAIADVLRGARRETFYVEDVVVDPRTGDTDVAVYAHPAALRELIAGCRELRDMMNSDAAGAFIGYQAPPLLNSDEEATVRQLIGVLEKSVDDTIVPFRQRAPEAA